VLAVIAPPEVVTFQTPATRWMVPPVEVPLASVWTLKVHVPAGMTVSVGAAAPPLSTIQPLPSGVVLGGATRVPLMLNEPGITW